MLNFVYVLLLLAKPMNTLKSCLVLVSSMFFVGFLTSCQTAYGPSGDYGGFPHGGYSDSMINQNTAIVNFVGNKDTPQRDVATYLLYRNAKITIENGYTSFIIVSSSSSPLNINAREMMNNEQGMIEPPTMHRTYYYGNDYMAYSTTTTATEGFTQPANVCDVRSGAHSGSNVIKMYKSRAPRGVPNAYNAYDVVAHLGPAVQEY